jgi:hypothetical protein
VLLLVCRYKRISQLYEPVSQRSMYKFWVLTKQIKAHFGDMLLDNYYFMERVPPISDYALELQDSGNMGNVSSKHSLDRLTHQECICSIQFGHNDRQYSALRNQLNAYISITEKVMNTSDFASNLESLTLIIKEAGCKPILVTSLARRVFASEHVTSDILGPYSNETINVAAKLKLPVGGLLLPESRGLA